MKTLSRNYIKVPCRVTFINKKCLLFLEVEVQRHRVFLQFCY